MRFIKNMYISYLLVLLISGCKSTNIIQATVSEKDGMKMVYVPEGEFLMGTTQEEIDQYKIDMGSKNLIYLKTKLLSIRFSLTLSG